MSMYSQTHSSARARAWSIAALFIAGTGGQPLMAEEWFVDVTATAGVDFYYAYGGTGQFYFPEIMGGGVALFDFDRDGLLDLYLVQGGEIGPGIEPDDRTVRDRLYRNTSMRDANGQWRIQFEDVTARAGIDARGYGMGVVADDVSGDGWPDLYVMNFGANQLWLNNGDGTFRDATAAAGVDDTRWSVSGSFGDLNNDGLLDLVVVNYADYTIDSHRQCRASGTNRPDYCSPSAYPGENDSAFINRGDGTFTNASEAIGLNRMSQHGLGVILADLDWNGHVDLYIANDGTANAYLLNQGNLTFIEDAFLAGSAVNADGAPEASMGVDAADVDRNGGEDLFITHLKRETNTLYLNDGQGWFRDATTSSGLGPASLPSTGFGTGFVDIENDGWIDLVAVNGAVVVEEEQVQVGSDFPYRQPNQVFR
ncbi:MAG: VCBS repeat-containing protein, partial [Pseudomonadota bacterium]